MIEEGRAFRTGFGSTDSVFGLGPFELECGEASRGNLPEPSRRTVESFFGEATTGRVAETSFVRRAVSNWTSPRAWTNRKIGKEAAKSAITQLSVLCNEGLLDDSSPQSVQRLLEIGFGDEPRVTMSTLNEALARKNLDRTFVYALCDAVGRVATQKVEALAFLTGLLRSPDASIRDAALLGISLLDDARAVPALREALGREKRVLLRETIEAILSDA